MTRRNDEPSTGVVSSEIDVDSRQKMATRKLRALLQTDATRDSEIRGLLKTKSSYDVAKQLGLL
jgi:hypothetical protein